MGGILMFWSINNSGLSEMYSKKGQQFDLIKAFNEHLRGLNFKKVIYSNWKPYFKQELTIQGFLKDKCFFMFDIYIHYEWLKDEYPPFHERWESLYRIYESLMIFDNTLPFRLVPTIQLHMYLEKFLPNLEIVRRKDILKNYISITRDRLVEGIVLRNDYKTYKYKFGETIDLFSDIILLFKSSNSNSNNSRSDRIKKGVLMFSGFSGDSCPHNKVSFVAKVKVKVDIENRTTEIKHFKEPPSIVEHITEKDRIESHMQKILDNVTDESEDILKNIINNRTLEAICRVEPMVVEFKYSNTFHIIQRRKDKNVPNVLKRVKNVYLTTPCSCKKFIYS